MYLRDIKTIRFGDLAGGLAPNGLERDFDWIIKSVTRRTSEILNLECTHSSGKGSAHFTIKATHTDGAVILDRIQSSKSIVGLTINQLRDTLFEKLF